MHPVVIGAIAGSWLLALVAEFSGHARSFHHDALVEGGPPMWAALGLFALAWQAMIGAMMLPSSMPLIALYERVSANAPRRGRARLSFLGGYAVVWTAFGLVAFVGDVGIHRLVDRWTWLAGRPYLIAGTTLALAGAFQFSSLKDRCLRECRSPGAFILKHYRRGSREAFRLGWGHGLFCVGCCWALMLVAFAAGVANSWWMAAFTALMVHEKTAREGDRAVAPVGVGLLLAGLGCVVLRLA